ncbi:30S ribosomal protein S1 [bacterium AH-315-C07]|nr:30S ribosomal protein S1 [bacterium AH-315-C07]
MSNEEKNELEAVVENGVAEAVEEQKVETTEKKASKAKTKEKAAPVVDADFDWVSFVDKQEYSETEKKKLEEMYGATMKSIAEHEIVDGTIVNITNREVVLNIGYKSEGVVSLSEFRDTPDMQIGDTVEVYIDEQEDTNGQLVLSRKKAKAVVSWDNINSAYENDTLLQGLVKSRTKGGLIVDVMGLECFLPGSQIDTKPIRDYDAFVNKTMELKVVKINHEFKNVVVSHKVLIEQEIAQQRAEIISKLEKGQVLEGNVKNITDFGVFIDLGGVDGLLHITDISWERIDHPKEVLDLDQKINVVVLDYDEEKTRIALGLKQLTPHPWDSMDKALEIGSKVKGKIVTVADYGAFLEIAPGVGGLIHVSEMTYSSHMRDPNVFVKVGEMVDAIILTLDKDDRKMSLGMKQMKEDPWDGIETKYAIESKQSAIVRNITNFGVFVEVEEGVDGLIHISDLSWSRKIKHPKEMVTVGDSIEVVVLEVDKDSKRLTLGHKQIEENPWETYEGIFAIGTTHKASITSITGKGAVILLPYSVEGFVPAKMYKKEDGEKPALDETLDFVVTEFSKENKRIILSHVATYSKEEDEATKKEVKAKKASKTKVKAEKSTLGDIEALSALKDQMDGTAEKTEKKAEKKVKASKGKTAEVVEDTAAPAETAKEEPAADVAEEEAKVEKAPEVKAEESAEEALSEESTEEAPAEESAEEAPAEESAEEAPAEESSEEPKDETESKDNA